MNARHVLRDDFLPGGDSHRLATHSAIKRTRLPGAGGKAFELVCITRALIVKLSTWVPVGR
jgi:hypothetical protein